MQHCNCKEGCGSVHHGQRSVQSCSLTCVDPYIWKFHARPIMRTSTQVCFRADLCKPDFVELQTNGTNIDPGSLNFRDWINPLASAPWAVVSGGLYLENTCLLKAAEWPCTGLCFWRPPIYVRYKRIFFSLCIALYILPQLFAWLSARASRQAPYSTNAHAAHAKGTKSCLFCLLSLLPCKQHMQACCNTAEGCCSSHAPTFCLTTAIRCAGSLAALLPMLLKPLGLLGRYRMTGLMWRMQAAHASASHFSTRVSHCSIDHAASRQCCSSTGLSSKHACKPHVCCTALAPFD